MANEAHVICGQLGRRMILTERHLRNRCQSQGGSVFHVLLWSYPFQVIYAVVYLVGVTMINLVDWSRWWSMKCLDNQTVNQNHLSLPISTKANTQISTFNHPGTKHCPLVGLGICFCLDGSGDAAHAPSARHFIKTDVSGNWHPFFYHYGLLIKCNAVLLSRAGCCLDTPYSEERQLLNYKCSILRSV